MKMVRNLCLAVTGIFLLIGCELSDESPADAVDRTEETSRVFAYSEETLRVFRRILDTEEWTAVEPPYNPQGMALADHNGTGLRFVLIPEGEFLIGSPEAEAGRSDDERQHVVTIRMAFLLSETECTQKAWERGGGKNESWIKVAERPVTEVSWQECHAWCARNGLRLPSEAEWEYAFRGGTTTPFSFGRTITPEQVNYDGRYPYGGADKGKYRRAPEEAGILPANPWGLFEMHGNVLEWCEDWLGEYSEAPSDGTARTERGDATLRVERGGSWSDDARACRSASRAGSRPLRRRDDLGFRPACWP